MAHAFRDPLEATQDLRRSPVHRHLQLSVVWQEQGVAILSMPLAPDLEEVELTIHEVLEFGYVNLPEPGIATPHAALLAAEETLDHLPKDQRPLWLLPMRAELAILRRRSVA